MINATTVARPYANAAFKLAEEKGAVHAWQSCLNALAIVVKNPEFLAFATSPATQEADVIRLFESVLDQPLEADFARFIGLLFQNKRLFLLSEISVLFEEKLREKAQRLRAVIQSAYPLDKRFVDRIASWLQEKYKRNVDIETCVNPELIGGVVVHLGDEVLDLSIKGFVEQTQHILASS